MRLPSVSALIERAVAKALAARVDALQSPVGQMPTESRGLPYRHDNAFSLAFPHSPKRRPGSLITVDTLRNVADGYDVLRSCINHLKREVWTVPIGFAPRDPEMPSDKAKRLVKEAEGWFGEFGGLGGHGKRRTLFEGEVLEDLMVVGAGAVYLERAKSGRLLSASALDAGTIRPVVDAYGWAPERAYEQWVQGVAVGSFEADELVYDGVWSVSYSPYFRSPVEWLVNVVVAALHADAWNREYLVSGNTPADLIAAPDSWTAQQVIEYGEWFDAVMAGDMSERRRTRIVPGGTSRLGGRVTTDREFSDLELWMLRRTCAIMGVQPAAIGFVGEQYKVSQEGSMDQTSQFGAGVLIEWRKSLYDRLLIELGLDELEVVETTEQPQETPAEKTDRVVKLVGKPVLTINEGRAEFGLPPVENGDDLGREPEPIEPAEEDAETDADEEERVERAGVDIAWKPTPKRRKKASKLFEAALNLFATQSDRLVSQYAEASFDDASGAAERFGKAFADLLVKSHVQAAKAGATLTGVSPKAAIEIGKAAAEAQKAYADGFTQDLLDGKLNDAITDALAEEAMRHRAKLYAHALTGTANEAAVAAIPEGTPIHWKLDPNAEHCDDCPSLANMGPYTPETLPCHPGDGFTECGHGCKCGLHLDDGTYVSIHDWSDPETWSKTPKRRGDLDLWERKALRRLKAGKSASCPFESDAISAEDAATILRRLAGCATADDVKAVFGGI